jgi:hypothetical protein
MFESGHPEKLSMESVKRVAEILEIPFKKEATVLPDPDIEQEGIKKGYCPNADCLSNIPFVINGEPVIHPSIKPAGAESRYCTVCGEVLEKSCPECGGPVTEGAFCSECGSARITATIPAGMLPEEWTKKRQAEIREFRLLVPVNNGWAQ